MKYRVWMSRNDASVPFGLPCDTHEQAKQLADDAAQFFECSVWIEEEEK